MRRTLAIATTLLLAIPAGVLAGGGAQPQDPPGARAGRLVPTLTVSGDGQASVKPDLALVRLGVSAQEKDAATVQSKVNESMQRIIDSVKNAQVPAEQIQTSGLSLHPLLDYRPPRNAEEAPPEPRVLGYRGQMVITVRLTDLKRVGPVVDAALAAGANTLQGISFALQDDGPAKAEALKKAVRSARIKAEALASALGVDLAQLLEVTEAGTHIMEPMYDAPQMAMAREAMPATPVEPGEVQVSASVSLRYRMAGPGVAGPDDERPR